VNDSQQYGTENYPPAAGYNYFRMREDLAGFISQSPDFSP